MDFLCGLFCAICFADDPCSTAYGFALYPGNDLYGEVCFDPLAYAWFGKADSSVVTEECGTLMLYRPVSDGMGMEEAADGLVVGQKYIFVVNKYLLYDNFHNFQDIKEADGSPVNFGSSE